MLQRLEAAMGLSGLGFEPQAGRSSIPTPVVAAPTDPNMSQSSCGSDSSTDSAEKSDNSVEKWYSLPSGVAIRALEDRLAFSRCVRNDCSHFSY
jgi:hypothetical protein